MPLSNPRLQFVKNGQLVTLDNVPPSCTLLSLLRETLGQSAAKEGCGEGDCGACTVVLAELQFNSHGIPYLTYKAINACIRLAHSVQGQALWTADGIAPAAGELHPVQQSLVDAHASQCGFCTPGFVMSMFALYQNHILKGQIPTREHIQSDLSGNLCRCTGYRPILDAAAHLHTYPPVHIDEALIIQQLQSITQQNTIEIAKNNDLTNKKTITRQFSSPLQQKELLDNDFDVQSRYLRPTTREDLLQIRAQYPKAQIVAGCTDVGIWITKLHKEFEQILDITRVAELKTVSETASHLRIGSAVTLNDALGHLQTLWPQLATFEHRFAALPIRNSGTLGGNIANGSPIGDSMPLLIALNATLELASVRGTRSVALDAFYTAYRQTTLAQDEIITAIEIPKPSPNEYLRVYKISKRFDDDISAICLAINLEFTLPLHSASSRWLDTASRSITQPNCTGLTIAKASIGVGGVAATPVRAYQTQSKLAGQIWLKNTANIAAKVLQEEFSPISDMRASAHYRTRILGHLVQRLWLESSQTKPFLTLDNLHAAENIL